MLGPIGARGPRPGPAMCWTCTRSYPETPPPPPVMPVVPDCTLMLGSHPTHIRLAELRKELSYQFEVHLASKEQILRAKARPEAWPSRSKAKLFIRARCARSAHEEVVLVYMKLITRELSYRRCRCHMDVDMARVRIWGPNWSLNEAIYPVIKRNKPGFRVSFTTPMRAQTIMIKMETKKTEPLKGNRKETETEIGTTLCYQRFDVNLAIDLQRSGNRKSGRNRCGSAESKLVMA